MQFFHPFLCSQKIILLCISRLICSYLVFACLEKYRKNGEKNLWESAFWNSYFCLKMVVLLSVLSAMKITQNTQCSTSPLKLSKQCIKRSQNASIFNFPNEHSVWKSPKMSQLIVSILAFSANFWPIKTDMSGNSVWPQALSFQKLVKLDHFWNNFCPLKM